MRKHAKYEVFIDRPKSRCSRGIKYSFDRNLLKIGPYLSSGDRVYLKKIMYINYGFLFKCY